MYVRSLEIFTKMISTTIAYIIGLYHLFQLFTRLTRKIAGPIRYLKALFSESRPVELEMEFVPGGWESNANAFLYAAKGS